MKIVTRKGNIVIEITPNELANIGQNVAEAVFGRSTGIFGRPATGMSASYSGPIPMPLDRKKRILDDARLISIEELEQVCYELDVLLGSRKPPDPDNLPPGKPVDG